MLWFQDSASTRVPARSFPVEVLVAALLTLLPCPAAAQDDPSNAAEKAADSATSAQSASNETSNPAQQQASETTKTVEHVSADITDKQGEKMDVLQKQLDAQAVLLATQAASTKSADATLKDLQRMLDKQKTLIESQKEQLEQQGVQLRTATELLTNMQSQIDQLKQDDHDTLSDQEVAMRERMAELEKQVGKIPDDPSTLLADADFPGAIRVPGTNASYKIGGYVKAVMVRNFDPLVTQDRFIVGSIPVTSADQSALSSETNLTANQTRVNFDYRQKSTLGHLRAFVEGDFAGPGDNFQMRHAFGQFRDLLAGKTWSAFYDAEAAPEQVDFEGINGRIVIRQTQVRYFPKIGEDFRWMISLEDPNPQVTGGEGVSNLPDIVTSIRRDWFGDWHVKSGLLLRQIRAINNAGVDLNGQPCEPAINTVPGIPDLNGCIAIADTGAEGSVFGWALTASGKVQVPWWNEKDNFLFQLNYGVGLGRYLTDLRTIESLKIDGGTDAFVDPSTGKIESLPVFGGYLAFQHWWRESLRSTFVYSLVNVDNISAQLFSAYGRTDRFSGNLIWSPMPNIDIGAEYLWGKRTNKGPEPVTGFQSSSASQIQLEAVYRF